MDAQCAMRVITDEATTDIEDMQAGLAVARASILRLLTLVSELSEPRDIKVVVEANRTAIDTIRRIRGLDDVPAARELTYEESLQALYQQA